MGDQLKLIMVRMNLVSSKENTIPVTVSKPADGQTHSDGLILVLTTIQFFCKCKETKEMLMMVITILFLNMTICINTRNLTGVLTELRVLMDSFKEQEKILTMVIIILLVHTMICNNIRNSIGVKKILLKKPNGEFP